MELKRVVTGLGALTPMFKNIGTLLLMVSAAAPSPFDASKFKTQFACELKL
jgi:3-oxoacyl-[acyl-carrier-protein] synthase II